MKVIWCLDKPLDRQKTLIFFKEKLIALLYPSNNKDLTTQASFKENSVVTVDRRDNRNIE